jgi:hypothetical protein
MTLPLVWDAFCAVVAPGGGSAKALVTGLEVGKCRQKEILISQQTILTHIENKHASGGGTKGVGRISEKEREVKS